MPEDAPKQIDDLALALLLSRLDTQDVKQDATLKEVRKTNGSVRDLQSRVGTLEATKADERIGALEQRELVADDRLTQGQLRGAKRDLRITRLTQAACVLTGAGLVDVGHVLHLW